MTIQYLTKAGSGNGLTYASDSSSLMASSGNKTTIIIDKQLLIFLQKGSVIGQVWNRCWWF